MRATVMPHADALRVSPMHAPHKNDEGVQQFAKVVLTACQCVIDLTERPAKKCEGAIAFFT
jgi:hypothetical protein